MLSLTISTSNHICAVCLHKNAQYIDIATTGIKNSHASLLVPLIEDILQKNNYNINNLNAIAIAAGPGSYTGLRIGITTAQSLCFALSIPLIKINILKAMAYAIHRYNEKIYQNKYMLFCPMIDARRMEVYCLLADQQQNIIEKSQAKIIDHNSFKKYLRTTKILFVGDGAQKCVPVINHPNAHFLGLEVICPDYIKAIGKIAHTAYLKKKFVDITTISPIYLKDKH